MLSLTMIGLPAAAVPQDEEEPEQEIRVKQVPKSVIKAARQAVKGFKPSEVEVEAILIFELEGTADGKTYEIEVAANGKVLSSEAEEDEDENDAEDQEDADEDDEPELEIPLSSVPSAVKSAAMKAVKGLTLSEAEVETVLVYELEGTARGKAYEISVTAEGDVIAIEEEGQDEKDDN
jgi:hypothetical protein